MATAGGAQPPRPGATPVPAADGRGDVPELTALSRASKSELEPVVSRFVADLGALGRRHDAELGGTRRERLGRFFAAWQAELKRIPFGELSQEARVDYVLMEHRLAAEQERLAREERQLREILPLVPFAARVTGLQEARRRMDLVDPAATASTFMQITASVEAARRQVEATLRPGGGDRPSPVLALRAALAVETLHRMLAGYYAFYSGYDPLFTWWAQDPQRKADEALRGYARFLRERVVEAGAEGGPVVGDPIGEAALRAELAEEMIPYAPRELLQIAEREFAWCQSELQKAAKEMGYDDWRAALEKVKTLHVEPGKQTELVRQLAVEATEWVEKRDLVTVPALAKETWRIEMMSPERQRVSPFFTGGEVISVAFPTDSMAHDDKLMSLRGNNIHFSRATVHHELIPGHHLQQYMTSRYNPHRRAFGTPFWTEGWALYWEMLMWDLGFPRGPEDRIGMLFWRSHRAARIMFSLGFHLGRMTPKQAVELLVDRVGHERANAEAEVRRSFNGTYPPLYQAAYMLGGLQFRALHQEAVGSGRMTNRQFHDTILQGGTIPVEMVRARLLGTPLRPGYRAEWRFTGK